MACPINVVSVEVLDNPAPFKNPLSFLVTYECLYQLNNDLEWRLTYVGDAESETHDQVLDSVLVGPVYPGQYRFVFQVDPPDADKLQPENVVGITAVLLTCLYADKEFVRVGYYVNNEYPEEETALREDPPKVPLIDKLMRNILADQPRVTKFPVDWDPPADGIPFPDSDQMGTDDVPAAGALRPPEADARPGNQSADGADDDEDAMEGSGSEDDDSSGGMEDVQMQETAPVGLTV